MSNNNSNVFTPYSNLSPDEFRRVCDCELPDSWPLAQEIKRRLHEWCATQEDVGDRLEDVVAADDIEMVIKDLFGEFLVKLDHRLGLAQRLDLSQYTLPWDKFEKDKEATDNAA